MFGLTGSTDSTNSEASGAGFKPHHFMPRVVQYRQRPLPKIVIAREAYAKMWLYVDIASEEVGWMGTAEQTPDGNFYIDKVFLLKQEVTGVETEMSNEGLSELATELLSSGDQGLKDWDNLRFWGHSHVRMGTSPSGTDERTMRMLEEAQHPWFIRGILNKLGRIEFTLFLYEENLVVEDARWTVEPLPPGAQPPAQTVTVEAEPVKPEEAKPTVEVDDRTPLNLSTEGGALQLRKPVNVPWINPLYKPELAAGLRKEVEREFKAKVTSRSWSWAPWKRKAAEDSPVEGEANTADQAASGADLGAVVGAPQSPESPTASTVSGVKPNISTNKDDTQ
jgi:hypothetical protein